MDVSCVHGSVYRVVLWQLAMETAQLMARTMHCSSVPTMIRSVNWTEFFTAPPPLHKALVRVFLFSIPQQRKQRNTSI